MRLHMSSAFEPALIGDHANHVSTDQQWWQESAFFMMCDAKNGVIGYYRIGRHPHLGHGNAYYWTSAQTLVLDDKQFRPGQPMPAGDVNNTVVAELRFETIRPMEEYRLSVDRPNYRMEVTWRPFFWPIMIHSAVKGASFAAGHYNAIGHATGFIETDGGRVDVDAYGYMDHSWGERKNHFPASKWIFAAFDPETFVQAFPVMSLDGGSKHLLGYVAVDGKLRKLTDDYETGFGIRDDWMTPSACDFRVKDEDGRLFRFTGTTSGPESIYPFLHGKFCVHALASFDFEGRPGRGLLENSPPRAIPGVYQERYELDPSGIWLNASH
ncbi:MAG: hypothetical protein J0I73_11130 [Sphingomonas sp.]|uniref:DUF7064 domain-containing protein n=3 Tax=Sphingomonas TaxID=13687 RepID=UPI001AC48780|nr:hypothetical protein [Sphingomonas sp.]MBN8848634.1 hypothetical protein [Sphingomonas sp.]